MVEWDFEPTDPSALVYSAPAIVVAEVADVREGETLVFDAPSDGGTG